LLFMCEYFSFISSFKKLNKSYMRSFEISNVERKILIHKTNRN
jgi:hypothetical protein